MTFCDIASLVPRFRVEQLELFGSAFDGGRWGWDYPTTMVIVDVKRRLSMPRVTQCVLLI
jgi:hypothetical protein